MTRADGPIESWSRAARRTATVWLLGGATESLSPVGWADQSLKRALLVALLPLSFAWSVVLILVGFSVSENGWELVVALAHIVVLVMIPMALAQRIPPAVPLLSQLILVALGWAVIGQESGPMSLATAWASDFALIAAALLLGRVGAVACVAAAIVMPTVIHLAHPGWSLPFLIAAGVTPAVILLVSRLALGPLHAFAARIDAEGIVAEEVRRSAASALAAQRDTAERARTLHDTAINTLGAIAGGGDVMHDLDAVRHRCEHDVEALETVIMGDRSDQVAQWRLPVSARGYSLTVIRSGVSDEELELLAPRVPVAVRQAIYTACGELLQNAARHSGADAASISARIERSELVVTVHDDGCGFDSRRLPRPGHGLAESVIGRLSDVDVDVVIDSRLMHGSTITIRCALNPSPSDVTTGDGSGFEAAVASIQRRASLSWSFGLIAVGALLKIADNPFHVTATYAMLAVGLVLSILVWRLSSTSRPNVVLLALTFVSTPIAYLLGFAGVDFGQSNLALWQALGPTIPLVLLQAFERRIAPLLAALGLLALTVLATTVVVSVNGTGVPASVALIGGSVPLVAVFGWFVFYQGLTVIGRRAEADEAASERVRLETAIREAIEVSRSRWRASGLQGTLQILHKIADGSVSPESPAVQHVCRREETYLRQLIQISPRAARLGAWFARILKEAYEYDVSVEIRSGDTDVDEESAAGLGTLLLEMVRTSSPGSSYVLGLFESENRQMITIVGPAEQLEHQPAPHVTAEWQQTRQTFGAECLIELSRASV
ncbi:sensor histidine kinase [Subtercola endophyticus]|uniref:sensor histidine kinase n=1 Tax=Subtercola endophyticus TaxID=2895559 RepID=UPI0036F1E001